MYLSSSNILQSNSNVNTTLQIPSLLNFDFNNSNCLLSPDNSFAIFFSDSVVLNVDLKTKRINWYKKLDNNEKIADLQINSNNEISFIKKLETHNEIVVLSNNNCMNFNELKIKENILAYKLFQSENSNDYNDMIIIVNDFFQISLYQDNLLKKNFSRNISEDIENELIQYKNKIVKIDYIPEQKLILFFFDNGLIVIYSLNSFSNENILTSENNLEYVNLINLNKGEDFNYTYDNFRIHKNNYICDNNKGDMDIENNSDINSSKGENYITTFLMICTNQKCINKRKSTIFVFRIENGKFIPLKNSDDLCNNKITFDNKEIVDSSIFKYKINNDENDMSDYIFLIFKNINNLNNNKFTYSTEYSNLFHCFYLDKDTNENENKKNFEIFEIFEEFPNSHIYINNINLSQKKPKIFSISYCKLGEKIVTIEHNNENLNNNIQNLNDLLSSNNYNDYITQLNSINFDEEQFNDDIKNKYKEIYDIDLDEDIFKLDNEYNNLNKEDISKINYFLLNLIANQSLFKIKNYLLKRNALNTSYIFPIEQICLTCNFLIKCLKNKIKKDKKRNNEIEKLLSIIINILKIVQNRNRAYKGKLFGGEKEIMLEQESMINSMIFDLESLLFIYKIQNLYFNINSNEINIINNNIIGNSFFNIFSLHNNIDNDFQLEDNEYEKMLENFNNLHLIYLDMFKDEKLSNLFNPKVKNPISLNALLYYIKFLIFNNYFYIAFPKEINNLNDLNEKDLNKSEYFKKILPELKNYFEISKALFILDNGGKNEYPNANISYLIKLLQYISKERLIMNSEINKILPLNRNIYEFIEALKENNYLNEALTIGNSLFSFLSSFDEFNSYLISTLKLKDYPLAYSFLNNCLFLNYQNAEQENKIKQFMNSQEYLEIKKMYYIFYEYLICNKAIDIIFKLPLNFIEIYIFKEFCEENEKYREFFIIYFIIIGNISEAKYYFQKYINLNGDNDSPSKILYANLIKYYEILMNKKVENEKVDEIIEKICTENKFLLKIDDNKEKLNLEEKRKNEFIKDNIGYSESLMKSSIMENKIITGTNYNVADYDRVSSNLMINLSSNFNKNLSSNYLSKENKKIHMNEIKPFSNSKLSPIKFENSLSNKNFISSQISKNK